jgi:hypothetical protein
MSQQELLKTVVAALDSCGIPYMLTGSIASGLYGEPRATHDIDLVADVASDQVAPLTSCFRSPSYFLQTESVQQAIAKRSMFNLLAIDEGDKVDFWLLTDQPFDASRFSRRVRKTIGGLPVWVSTPEDSILAKLRWCRLAGGSEKQMNDALRVYEVQRGTLDESYVAKWAESLGVDDLWQRLKNTAGDIDLGDP